MSAVEDVRDWVGTGEDADAIAAQLARFAGQDHVVERAALAILLRREADSGAAKWGVSGDYSEDDSEGRKALAARISRLRAIVGDEVSGLPTLGVASIVGPGNLR